MLLRLRVGTRVSTLAQAEGSCSGTNADLGIRPIYVSSSGRIAIGVKQTFVAFIKEKEGVDEEGAVKIFTEMMKDRYATDIFE